MSNENKVNSITPSTTTAITISEHVGQLECLPERNSELISLYSQDIKDQCGMAGFSVDLESTIELLTISYNITPHKYGAIKGEISGIQRQVVAVQSDAVFAMRKIRDAAEIVSKDIERLFLVTDSILNQNEKSETDRKEAVLTIYLRSLKKLQDAAKEQEKQMLVISQKFSKLTDAAFEITKKSEKTLGEDIKEQEKVRKEIAEYTAQEKGYNNIKKELQKYIDKYHEKAEDLAKRAESAEDKAFTLALFQIGASALAGVAGMVIMSRMETGKLAVMAGTSKVQADAERDATGKSEAELTVQLSQASSSKKKEDERIKRIEEDIAKLRAKINPKTEEKSIRKKKKKK